jgi:hypothetical protein
MKATTAYVAFLAAIVPAAWSLPTNAVRQFKPSTCGAEQCLNGTSGLFDGVPPSNLTALCGLDQSEVTRYVGIMQPCLGTIKNANGGPVCTAGGVWEYKYLLTSECTRQGKNATFPQ